mgnify:FL=1
MRVEVYYQDISRKFNAINHGLDLNTYCDRLKTLRIYLKEIAEVAYKNKEKVQERYSIDYFKSSTKLNFTHEPYIKKLSQLFGVRTFWKPCLDLDGKVVKGIKAIGIENQIKAFFSVVVYAVTHMDYDRRRYHKPYNVKLM